MAAAAIIERPAAGVRHIRRALIAVMVRLSIAVLALLLAVPGCSSSSGSSPPTSSASACPRPGDAAYPTDCTTVPVAAPGCSVANLCGDCNGQPFQISFDFGDGHTLAVHNNKNMYMAMQIGGGYPTGSVILLAPTMTGSWSDATITDVWDVSVLCGETKLMRIRGSNMKDASASLTVLEPLHAAGQVSATFINGGDAQDTPGHLSGSFDITYSQ